MAWTATGLIALVIINGVTEGSFDIPVILCIKDSVMVGTAAVGATTATEPDPVASGVVIFSDNEPENVAAGIFLFVILRVGDVDSEPKDPPRRALDTWVATLSVPIEPETG